MLKPKGYAHIESNMYSTKLHVVAEVIPIKLRKNEYFYKIIKIFHTFKDNEEDIFIGELISKNEIKKFLNKNDIIKYMI